MRVWANNTKKQKLARFLIFVMFLLFASQMRSILPTRAVQQVPQYIGYSGYLTNSSDTALSSTYDMEFKIYDALTGGNLLWTENHTNVTASNGYFSVQLGDTTALSLDFDIQYWVSVNVEADGEMSPRLPINSAAYAYTSDITYGAYTTTTAPIGVTGGEIFYDTDDGNLYVYDATSSAWVDMTGVGTTVSSTYIDALGYVSSTDLYAGDDLTVTDDATIGDALVINGNVTLGNANTDTVTFNADVASNILPSSNNGLDLGAFGSAWNDIYASGTAYAGVMYIEAGLLAGQNNNTQNGAWGNAWSTLYVSSTSYLADVNVTGDIDPNRNNAVDLGAFGSAWNELFVSGTAYLGPTYITGGVAAEQNNNTSLGLFGNAWSTLYVSNTSYLADVNVAGDIDPNSNNARDIGDYGSAYNDIFSSGTTYVGILSADTAVAPTTNNDNVLGSWGFAWSNFYVSGTSYLGAVSLDGDIDPTSNNTRDIGDYGLAFNDIFSSGTIYADTILFASGTESAPGLAFSNDTDTGFYADSAGTMSLAINGSSVFAWDADGVYPNSGNSYDLGSFDDSSWADIYASGTLYIDDMQLTDNSLKTSTSTLTLGSVGWTGNNLQIYDSGVANQVKIGTDGSYIRWDDHIVPHTDSGLNFGAVGAEWLNAYMDYPRIKRGLMVGATAISTLPPENSALIQDKLIVGSGSTDAYGKFWHDATDFNLWVGTGDFVVSSSVKINSNETTDTNNIFILNSDVAGDDDMVLRVTATGTVYSDAGYYSTGADYAERFYSVQTDLQPGEIVCVDLARNNAVRRCESAADGNVMGVVSSNPSIVGNNTESTEGNPHYPVIGMLGQVYSRVSDENGLIRVGDSLTSASIPGYAMRANAGDPTVGVALEGLGSSSGAVKVLISRRNKSLTVETVEEEVAKRVAEMEIEDEVAIMIANAVENLNLDEDITEVVDEQIAALDLTSTITEILGVKIQEMDVPGLVLAEFQAYNILTTVDKRFEELMAEFEIDSKIEAAIDAYDLEKQPVLAELTSAVEETRLMLESGDIESLNEIETRIILLEEQMLSGEDGGLVLEDSGLQINLNSLSLGELNVLTRAKIEGELNVDGQVAFGGDTVGQVKILPGDKEVEVRFEKTYELQPIVTLSPLNKIHEGLDYTVRNVTTDSFLIEIDNIYEEDVEFSWHAFAVDQGKIHVSDDTKEDILIEVITTIKEEVAPVFAPAPVVQNNPAPAVEENPVVVEPEEEISEELTPVVEAEQPTVEEEVGQSENDVYNEESVTENADLTPTEESFSTDLETVPESVSEPQNTAPVESVPIETTTAEPSPTPNTPAEPAEVESVPESSSEGEPSATEVTSVFEPVSAPEAPVTTE